MKRLTKQQREYAIRVTRLRTARALWSKRRAKQHRKTRVPHILAAPIAFDLDSRTARPDLVRFLDRLKHHVGIKKRRVRINFSATERMTAGGTLLFAAEVSRLNALTAPSRLLSSNFPANDVVAQVLVHVGVLEMLNQRKTCLITADNVKYWRVARGTGADGASAADLLSTYEAYFTDVSKAALYRGMTEAMTNCCQHAYVEMRGDGLDTVDTRWWMFSQLKDEQLTVAICDLGIGIPRSLKLNHNGWWDNIRGILFRQRAVPSDANVIAAAMEVGATRTEQAHRGKGLMDIRTAIDKFEGFIYIHSNRGRYAYSAKENEQYLDNFHKRASICGTLVLWQLPLGKLHRQ